VKPLLHIVPFYLGVQLHSVMQVHNDMTIARCTHCN